MVRDKTDKTPCMVQISADIEFEDAVETIKSSFSYLLNESKEARQRDLKEFNRLYAASIGLKLLEQDSKKLIAWAEQEAEGFFTAKGAIAEHLLRYPERDMPVEARKWLIQLLEGKARVFPARIGRQQDNLFNLMIWSGVSRLVRMGMIATRNDASPPTSACDAVAQALYELGSQPGSFSGVKRVWLDFEKRLR